MVNIAADSKYIQGALQRVKEAKTPPELRISRRPVPPKDRVDVAQISKKQIQPQELKLHPEAPGVDEYKPTFEQCGTNLSVLLVLFPQAREMVQKAIQEQKVLAGAIG